MLKTILIIGAGLVTPLFCYLLTKPKGIIVAGESVEPLKPFGYKAPMINEVNSSPQIFINSGPQYYPKWKKLKYWQPTKKNPKRR